MTLLLGICALGAIIGFWLWQIERGLRLAAEYETDLIHSDYLALQERHEDALNELDYHVEAITANAKFRHPANSLSLVRGEGA